MVSQSWDGKRLYFSSSLLAQWDKTGADNDQFVRGYNWDGKELKPTFAVDFNALKLGRPHHMVFGARNMGRSPTVAANN
jgi:selenium-binding protein 1